MGTNVEIQHFFDEATSTLTYLVWDPETRDALCIDPVLDYEPQGSKTSQTSVDRISHQVKEQQLNLLWVLETHGHADHLSGAQILKVRHEAQIAIGQGIQTVQETFKKIYGLPESFRSDGSQFDKLLTPGEVHRAGSIEVLPIATPGHTTACMTYQIGDAIFTGDALFMDDYGTGRCDFPGGDAGDLFDSVSKLYELPNETRVFVAHDYQPGGREVRWQTTIGESKRKNPQLNGETTREAFVSFRSLRDKDLAAPRLLWPSIQVNIDGGRLPEPEKNGKRYLRIPLFSDS